MFAVSYFRQAAMTAQMSSLSLMMRVAGNEELKQMRLSRRELPQLQNRLVHLLDLAMESRIWPVTVNYKVYA